jgi:hypothetical protein
MLRPPIRSHDDDKSVKPDYDSFFLHPMFSSNPSFFLKLGCYIHISKKYISWETLIISKWLQYRAEANRVSCMEVQIAFENIA